MQSLLPDQRRSYQERNTLFLMLLVGVFFIHLWGMSGSQKRQEEAASKQEHQDILDKPVVTPPKTDAVATENAAIENTVVEPQWVTLGSMDPKSPYRMLVTLTNQGAAVVRAELNTEKYRDVQEPSGYLGQIVADTKLAEKDSDGVTVQVVGPGTPAHKFGLMVGDRIIRFNRKIDKTDKSTDEFDGKFNTAVIKNVADLQANLKKTRPGDTIELIVRRPGRETDLPLGVILVQHPMNVIRPESVPKNYDEYRELGGLHGVNGEIHDPLSFLTTLQKIDDQELSLPAEMGKNTSKLRGIVARDKTLENELDGVELREKPWELISSTENEAVFRRTVPKYNLEMRKTYRLAHLTGTPGTNSTPGGDTPGSGYHLTLKVEVRNLDTKERKVAYQLDGPTGLPLEGGWYARKTGPGWRGYGIRDIVVRFAGNAAQTVDNSTIATDRVATPWIDEPLDYIGVDSLYFQCTLKPQKPEGEDAWHVRSMPIRVGEKNADWPMLTNVSYRLLSREKMLQPGDGPDSQLEHEYSIFLGPKDTRVLAEYGLNETIAYGWFWFAAQPLLGILHFFHGLGMSYAMAIILLTICVRLLIFPMSLKQAAGAEKMKLIQPELKEINEKYKDDMQERSRATSALFKKHNYHPMSGCLPLFIQLPIFIGLYKALSIDAGLYGTPLISASVRWCSDLSAPDMLFDWSAFWTSIGWPGFNVGQGFFTLGPYFNLLPMLTIVLFLIQQAVMMPPPTDEQSRMQRKMMQYMMIFMGFMFFKIPSGLCIYFIVSTIWGLLERRFIPKPAAVAASGQTYDVTPTDKRYDSPSKGKKQRNKQPEKKEEGFFAKLMREVNEKASEPRKLEKGGKKKKR